MTIELHVRRGTFVNDDPQRRCYNGCYKAYHYEWTKWEKWFLSSDYETVEQAELDKKMFGRADLQFKVVITGESNA